MTAFKKIFRLIYIQWVLARIGCLQLLMELPWFAPLKFIIYLNPWNWYRKRTYVRGVALRQICETLGPIFIKFGQALSTRPDIFPADIILELTQLQNNVAPFPAKVVLQTLEKAFGKQACDIFEKFELQALAAASIAQVHAATLHSGEDVVVKILRPNIHQLIEQDLSLLRTLAHLAERYLPKIRPFKPKEIVTEFAQSLWDELDLQNEAANASQLRRHFTDSNILYVPKIYWEYVKPDVLVMERIYGIPVTDIGQLQAHGINLKRLAERGVEIFFTQVFRDCFFHADMHPGNIFVSMLHAQNPQYICVDFGIMGTINEYDKRYLAQNLLAFFRRDYRRVAELHVESGWVARNTRVNDFESAIRTVCEPIFEQPLKNISFALVVLRLFQVARRFHMEIQPQLMLLQKTLFAVEGLGRQIYPDLDLWATAKPFLERWMREQLGPKAFWQHIKTNMPFFMEQLPYMPQLIHDVLTLTQEKQRLAIKTAQLTTKNSIKTSRSRNYGWLCGIIIGIFMAKLF